MRHNIKKAREDGNILQIPLNCKDICVLQDKRKLIKSGELFSLVDNAERYPERMFIFTSEISIRFFYQSQNTVSMTKLIESAQKFSFNYILCMHKNVETLGNLHQILS